MEQIIDAAQGVLDSEFLAENTLSVFGPQCADGIGLGGGRQETRLEGCFFLRRQAGRATGLSLGTNGFEAMVSIRIDPALYKRSTTSQRPCDSGGILSFNG